MRIPIDIEKSFSMILIMIKGGVYEEVSCPGSAFSPTSGILPD